MARAKSLDRVEFSQAHAFKTDKLAGPTIGPLSVETRRIRIPIRVRSVQSIASKQGCFSVLFRFILSTTDYGSTVRNDRRDHTISGQIRKQLEDSLSKLEALLKGGRRFYA